jgi:hypothetical protein
MSIPFIAIPSISDLKFDDDRLVARPFADKFGAWIVKRSDCGGEIFDGDRLPVLGRVDDRRLENGLVVDHAIEGGAVARKGDTEPVVDDAAVKRVHHRPIPNSVAAALPRGVRTS